MGCSHVQAQTFYEGHSYEGLIWSFVREWIRRCLRARYQVLKELPVKSLALVRKLEAIESRSSRAGSLIGTLDAIEGNYLRRHAPPVEPLSANRPPDWRARELRSAELLCAGNYQLSGPNKREDCGRELEVHNPRNHLNWGRR